MSRNMDENDKKPVVTNDEDNSEEDSSLTEVDLDQVEQDILYEDPFDKEVKEVKSKPLTTQILEEYDILQQFLMHHVDNDQLMIFASMFDDFINNFDTHDQKSLSQLRIYLMKLNMELRIDNQSKILHQQTFENLQQYLLNLDKDYWIVKLKELPVSNKSKENVNISLKKTTKSHPLDSDEEDFITTSTHQPEISIKSFTLSKPSLLKIVKHEKLLSQKSELEINPIFLPSLMVIEQLLNNSLLQGEYEDYLIKAKKLLEEMKLYQIEQTEDLFIKADNLITEILDRQLVLQMSNRKSVVKLDSDLPSSSYEDVMKINEEIICTKGLTSITVPPLTLLHLMSYGSIEQLTHELKKMGGHHDERFIIVPVYPHNFMSQISEQEFAQKINNKVGHYATMVIDTKHNKTYYFDSMGIMSPQKDQNIYHGMAQPLIEKFNIIDLTPTIQIQQSGTNSCAQWYKSASLKICQLIMNESDNIKIDINRWAYHNSRQVEKEYRNRFKKSETKPQLRLREYTEDIEEVSHDKKTFKFPRYLFGEFHGTWLGKPKESTEETINFLQMESIQVTEYNPQVLVLEKEKYQAKQELEKMKLELQKREVKNTEKQNKQQTPPNIIYPIVSIEKNNQQIMSTFKDMVTLPPLTIASLNSLLTKIDRGIKEEEDTTPLRELAKMLNSDNKRFIMIPVFHSIQLSSQELQQDIEQNNYSVLIIDTQDEKEKMKAYFFNCCMGVKNIDDSATRKLLKFLDAIHLAPENQIDVDQINFNQTCANCCELIHKSIDEDRVNLGVLKEYFKLVLNKERIQEQLDVEGTHKVKDQQSTDPLEVLKLHVSKINAKELKFKPDGLLEEILLKNKDALFMLGENNICFMYDHIFRCYSNGYSIDDSIRILQHALDNLKVHISEKYSTEVKIDPKDLFLELVNEYPDKLFMLGEKSICFIYDQIFKLCNEKYSTKQAITILNDTIKAPLTSHINNDIIVNSTRLNDFSFNLLSENRLEKYDSLIVIDLTFIDETRKKSDKENKDKTPKEEDVETIDEINELDSIKIDEEQQKGEDENTLIPVIVKRQFPQFFDCNEKTPWQIIADCIIDQAYEVDVTRELYEGSESTGDKIVYGYRPNHGVTHSIKQLVFLEKYMDLLSRHGTSQYQQALDNLTKSELACMALAMFLYRSGRTNEDSGKANPFNIYRSRKIYEFIAKGFGFDENIYKPIGEGINIYTGLNTFLSFDPPIDKQFHEYPLYQLCEHFNSLFAKVNDLGPSLLDQLEQYPQFGEHLTLLLKECCSENPDEKNIQVLYKLISGKFTTTFKDKFPEINEMLFELEKLIDAKNLGIKNGELIPIMNMKIDKSILISSLLKICHGIDLVRCKKDQEDIVKEVEPHVLKLFDRRKTNINNLIDETLDIARHANILTGGKIECPSTRFEMVNSYNAKLHYECSRNVDKCIEVLSVKLIPVNEKLLSQKNLSEFRMMEKGGVYSTYPENIGVISPYRNKKGEIIARGEYATELIQKGNRVIECIRINSALFYTAMLDPVKDKPCTATTKNGYRDIHQNPLTGEIIWSSGKVYSSASYVAAGRLRRAGLWVAKYRAEHAWEYDPQAYVKKYAEEVLETKKKINDMNFTEETIKKTCQQLRDKMREVILNNPSKYNSSDILSAYGKIAELESKLIKYLELFEKFKINCEIGDDKKFLEFVKNRLIEFQENNDRQYIVNPENIDEAKSNVALIDEAKKYFMFEEILNNFKNFEAVLKRMQSIEDTKFNTVSDGKRLIENFLTKDNTQQSKKDKKKKGELETDLPTVIGSLEKGFSYPEDIEIEVLKKDDMRYVIQNPRIVSFLIPVEDFENIVNVAVEEETKTRYDYVATVDKRFEPNQFSFENRLLMNLRTHIVPQSFVSYHYNIYLRTPEQISQEGLSFSIDDMAESIGQSPSEFVLDDIWTSGTGFAAVGGIDLNKRANYLSNIYNTWQVINNVELAPLLFGKISDEEKALHLKKFAQFLFNYLPEDTKKEDVYIIINALLMGKDIGNTDPLFLLHKDILRLMKVVGNSADEARMQYTIMDNRMTLVNKEGYTSDTDIGHRPFIQIFSEKDIKTIKINKRMMSIGEQIAEVLKVNNDVIELPQLIVDILRNDPELNYRLLKPSTELKRCMMDKHIVHMVSKFLELKPDLSIKMNQIILAGLLFHDMEKHEGLLRAQSANRPSSPDNLTRDIMKRYFPLIEAITGKLKNKEKEFLLIAITNNPFCSEKSNQSDFKQNLKQLLLSFNSDLNKINEDKCVPLLQYALMIASIELNNKELMNNIYDVETLKGLIIEAKLELQKENEAQVKEWHGLIDVIHKISIDELDYEGESKQKTKEPQVKSEKLNKLEKYELKYEKTEYCNSDDNIIAEILDKTKLNKEELLKAFGLVSYNDFRNVAMPIVTLLKSLDPLDEDKLSLFYKNGGLKKDLSPEDKKMLEKLRQGRGERLLDALQNYQSLIPKDQKDILVEELVLAVMRERAHEKFLIDNEELNSELRNTLTKQPQRSLMLEYLQESEKSRSTKQLDDSNHSKNDVWGKIYKESESMPVSTVSKPKEKPKLKMTEILSKTKEESMKKDQKDTVSSTLDSESSSEEGLDLDMFGTKPALVEEFNVGTQLTIKVTEDSKHTYIKIVNPDQLKENSTFLDEFKQKLKENGIECNPDQEKPNVLVLSGNFKSMQLVSLMKEWFPTNDRKLNIF